MIFINLKKYIIKLLIIFTLIIPTTTLAYTNKVILGGETIGIEVNSKGVMVVGFYEVNEKFIAKEAGFKLGDTILKINNQQVTSIDDMVNIISHSKEDIINFNILRDNKPITIELKLIKTKDGIIKTGLYTKDTINGIGTLSYINPKTKTFSSLAHMIIDSKTNKKFEIKGGKIYDAEVTSIIKSKIGEAGEKNAIYSKDDIIGEIKENKPTGIYGTYNSDIADKETIEIAPKEEVTTGAAILKTVIKDDIIESFSINIVKINNSSVSKNIFFEITDERLLKETGGVVQGMSGSPIIQNNKLIGAVNYVVLNDPTKGYGIFIEKMLEAEP